MAKKKRGRPPGSKNKTSLGKSIATMDIAQLRAHIDALRGILAKKIEEQRSAIERQLSELGGYAPKKAGSLRIDGRKAKRGPAAPKYRSKKNKSVTWSGRGITPIWMREEMKGTKFTKDDFLIASR